MSTKQMYAANKNNDGWWWGAPSPEIDQPFTRAEIDLHGSYIGDGLEVREDAAGDLVDCETGEIVATKI